MSKFSKHQPQSQHESSSSTTKDANSQLNTHHSQSELLDRTFSSSNSCLQNDSNGDGLTNKSSSRLSRKLTSQQQQQPNSSCLSSSNDDTKTRRPRRPAYSSDRKISDKKKIEKSDISCPFRCSCNDLTDNANEPPPNPDLVKVRRLLKNWKIFIEMARIFPEQ